MLKLAPTCALVTLALGGCDGGIVGTSPQSPVTQDAHVAAQQTQVDAQLERNATQQQDAQRLLKQQQELMNQAAKNVERQAALLTKQEEQAKRYDALLDRWEKDRTR